MALKSTKTQLIAIYRLEFYKNKKNWKLYEDVKKEPNSPPCNEKTKLNKTYNVGEEFDVEPDFDADQVSPHNKAFLHEEPDDGPDPQPPDSVVPVLPLPGHCLYRQHSCPDQPWTGDKSEVIWQDAQQEWCGAEAEGMPEELAYDQCDGPCHQHMWTPVSQYEQLKPDCDPLDLPQEYLSASEMLHIAEEWLKSHGYPVLQEEYAPAYEQYGLLDDSADFTRGAHHAPHSSEVDLSLTPDECPCTCSESLCALSPRAVARAVQRHHSALTLLLGELALRDRLYSHSSLHPPIPFEDYPTRDTDPLRPPDCVLSGSHRATGTGRGRGRLHQTDRLIGIADGATDQNRGMVRVKDLNWTQLWIV